MLKNVFLAAVATLVLAAATVPVASTPALACHGCWKAAKAAGVKGMKARMEYRKACRAHYKAAKKAA
jgi:hypothetical protein